VNILGDFSGRKILVTGASRGLGGALFMWLAEQGAQVLGVGRSNPDFTVPEGSTFIALDLAERGNVAALIERAVAYQPDSVIHCLGGGFKRSSDFISRDDFLYLLDLNFTVGLEINNAVLPTMRENKRGWIVHLGSVATRELTASVGYTCAKSLITPYVKHMGRKFMPDGVYFSGITLGAMTGAEGAIDRLRGDRPEVYEKFLADRRPSQRATPVAELFPYFSLLLTENAKVHSSNMICLDEAEGKAI
jgi:NAD(P)-dependent dehydrogenase (short-subunit alcohol dehydrogenase family)